MNFSKKGGSSMDFMFTYGWAVFVVLLVILYLYLFGFLNPYNFIPEYCIMPSGFHCEDAVLNTFNSGSISGVGLVGMKVRNGKI
tara:strand:- start:19876 stop:20127 length:252 start_codon:yes stop_codon:yes gene_type:complete